MWLLAAASGRLLALQLAMVRAASLRQVVREPLRAPGGAEGGRGHLTLCVGPRARLRGAGGPRPWSCRSASLQGREAGEAAAERPSPRTGPTDAGGRSPPGPRLRAAAPTCRPPGPSRGPCSGGHCGLSPLCQWHPRLHGSPLCPSREPSNASPPSPPGYMSISC